MANTEGMSDDEMAHLLSTSTDDLKTPRRSDKRSKSRSAAWMMRERMMMDIGDRPAATVIRPSPSRSGKTILSSPVESIAAQQEEETSCEDQSGEEANSQPQQQPPQLAPLVGSIVERRQVCPHVNPNDDIVNSATTTTRKGPSQFSQSRNHAKNLPSQSVAAQPPLQAPPPSSGFPSVHVPFGTFVTRRNNSFSPNNGVVPPTKKNVKSVSFNDSTAANAATPTTISKNPQSDINSLKDVCQRDADSLLQSMTPAEIQEHVQELQSALSPETIEFLQSRRQKGKRRNQSKETETGVIVGGSPCQHEPPNPRQTTTFLSKSKSEREEKERIANLLSSIRTYDDLDKAYAAEMGFGDLTDDSSARAADETTDDFDRACELLRSTAPRQRLWAARVVSHHLRNIQRQSFYNNTSLSWPYPILLPVSLRCLLDERPATCGHSYHALLCTYVLQSIYVLLQLGAHPLHVVDVTGESVSESTIYQHDFLDDAIPTIPFGSSYPTMSVEPLVPTADDENGSSAAGKSSETSPGETEAVAYATSSSSTSSQSDGEAFRRDPMWTLLSKMRILPRLAQIVANQSRLPPEAMVPLCGMLAMLSVRSPGAGTAIVQHPQIMSNLMEQAMSDLSVWHENVDTAVASTSGNGLVLLPIMILLCTLARQSRVVAETIDERFLATLAPPILAKTASSYAEYRLQEATLCLWRILLRYGLGLSGLTTMITLSTAHLAVGRPKEHSLAVEFITAFSVVFYSIRVVGKTNMDETVRSISSDGYESLVMASSWLSSTVRQTIYHLSPLCNDVQLEKKQQRAGQWRLFAARLRLVSSFLSCKSNDDDSEWNEEVKTQDMTENERDVCLNSVKSMLDNGLVESALRVITPLAVSVDLDLAVADHDLSVEASACAFLEAFASVLLALTSSDQDSSNRSISFLVSRFGELVVTCFQPVCVESVDADHAKSEMSGQPRGRWINKACFGIAKVFLTTASSSPKGAYFVIRSLVHALLGRLQVGDEAMAALLLSHDSFFQATTSQAASPPIGSGISSMLLRELCRGNRSKSQLDHSFKVQRGYGLSAQGLRPFALESLLSEAHQVNTSGTESLLLPLGKLWLWQVLSGSVQFHLDEDASMALEEASDVVASCLELIIELETSVGGSAYVANVDRGAKLYHLFNVCLLPEGILSHEKVTALASALFEIYFKPFDNSLGIRFAQACTFHSTIVKRGCKVPDTQKDTQLQESAKKLGLDLQDSETRALDDFVNDLCEAYIGYGAQYEICTKCIRFFILPCFPTKIRCGVLQRLREVHHLLTLPSELDDPCPDGLRVLLEMTVTGGISNVDASARDNPALLDHLASCLNLGRADVQRTRNGYVFLLSIALLARSLAWSVKSGLAGFEAAAARVKGLPDSIAHLVVEVTSLVLSGAGTKVLIVDAVINVCISSCYSHILDDESFRSLSLEAAFKRLLEIN